MMECPEVTDISVVTDMISIYQKPTSEASIRYHNDDIDIGDNIAIFSIYRPISRLEIGRRLQQQAKAITAIALFTAADQLISPEKVLYVPLFR